MSGHHHHHGDGTAKTVLFNLSVNLLLTAAKWVAFFLTGSPSIFGEAAHSTADSANPILLWIGHRRGKRPPCADHPFGHGRETFFWALIAALTMLVAGACLTAWRGIETLVSGQAPEQSLTSLGIMGFALMAELFTLTLAWRRLKQEAGSGVIDRIRNSRNSVVLGVLLENGVDAAGVVLAFAGFGLYMLTGNPIWDALFSLAIAATLAASSLFLVWKNRSLLVGQAAPEHVEPLRQMIKERFTEVEKVTDLTVVSLGPEDFRCRLRLRFSRDRIEAEPNPLTIGQMVAIRQWSASELIQYVKRIESAIRENVHEITYVDIKIDL